MDGSKEDYLTAKKCAKSVNMLRKKRDPLI